MWHSVVGELLGCGAVSLVSCWDVALCCWLAVGMWHCVVGELLGCGTVWVSCWDVALCRW